MKRIEQFEIELEELLDKYMDIDTADLADSLDYYKTRYLNK